MGRPKKPEELKRIRKSITVERIIIDDIDELRLFGAFSEHCHQLLVDDYNFRHPDKPVKIWKPRHMQKTVAEEIVERAKKAGMRVEEFHPDADDEMKPALTLVSGSYGDTIRKGHVIVIVMEEDDE
jgi:hypothetical protein